MNFLEILGVVFLAVMMLYAVYGISNVLFTASNRLVKYLAEKNKKQYDESCYSCSNCYLRKVTQKMFDDMVDKGFIKPPKTKEENE